MTLSTIKKRNFTRQYNACGKITAFANAMKTTDAAANVKEQQEKLDKAYGEYIDAMDSLQLADSKNMDQYSRTQEDASDKYIDMTEKIMATIGDIHAPTPATAQVNNGNNRRQNEPSTRLAQALKPTLLTADFNPVEFKSWMVNFRSYYLCCDSVRHAT